MTESIGVATMPDCGRTEGHGPDPYFLAANGLLGLCIAVCSGWQLAAQRRRDREFLAEMARLDRTAGRTTPGT